MSLVKRLDALGWKDRTDDYTEIRANLIAMQTEHFKAHLQGIIKNNEVGSAAAQEIINELAWLEQNRVRIWIRGGISLNLSREETKTLLAGEYDDSEEVLRSALEERRFIFDGEFYIPERVSLPEGVVGENERNNSCWDLDRLTRFNWPAWSIEIKFPPEFSGGNRRNRAIIAYNCNQQETPRSCNSWVSLVASG